MNGEKVSKTIYNKGYIKSENYLILYEKDKEKYSGIAQNGKPKEGKDLTLYDDEGYIIYKGDFFNFNYHGNGILYFVSSNNIYFSGKFEKNDFLEGKLYDLEGKITYSGNFINNIPVEGKNIKLYNKYETLIYEGDIVNCKYDGKGKLYKHGYLFYVGEFKEGLFNGIGKIYNEDILYYEGNFKNNEINGEGVKYYKNGKKHLEGNFDFKNEKNEFNFEFSKKYVKGVIYDMEQNKSYETEIINFTPKEGKNIKLYEDDIYLIYDGDFFDYKYHGKGKLYTDEKYLQSEYKLKYDGEFKYGLFDGYGKLYKKFYKYVYYEGYFSKGEIKGKGIRFYKNGVKKLEGIFKDNNIFEGEYYSPNSTIIFEGKIINDIFYDSNFLEIYNDNEFLLYKGEIKNNYEQENFYNDFELLNDKILCRDIDNNYYKNINIDNKPFAEISFISEDYSGKTSLIRRFTDNEFLEGQINHNFAPDWKIFFYTYKNIKFKILINILHGNYCYHTFKIRYLKNSNIIIYVIDISEYNSNINETYLNDLFENMTKFYKFIYLVITKIDISENDINPFRKLAQKLIIDGMIYRYFEVSSKTGEGINKFVEYLKYDINLSLNLDKSGDQKKLLNPNYKLRKIRFKQLDKYLNF